MASTRHSAQGTVNRGLSPAIWQAYGFTGGNVGDPSLKPMFFDDLANVPLFTTNTTNIMANGYRTYQDNGVSIQNCAASDNSEGEFGVLEITGNDAAHDEGSIEMGGGTNGLVRIDPTAGERAVVAMEVRIKQTAITTGGVCFAAGLCKPAFADADAIVDTTGALVAAGKDFVGFQTLLGSNSEIDTVYMIDSGSTVQVADNAGTMVADTWIKLGMVYDPQAATDKSMKFFIDGAELGDSVTDAIITAATAFPTDQELSLVVATKVLTATAAPFYIDWLAIGSYLVDG